MPQKVSYIFSHIDYPSIMKIRVSLLHFEFILCHVFEIEFIEMSEPAVLATDRKVTATYRYIV